MNGEVMLSCSIIDNKGMSPTNQNKMRLINRKDFNNWMEAADNVDDDHNPAFAFQGLSNKVLAAIASGEIDAKYLARMTMANRGVDSNGAWIGFNKAMIHHNVVK